MRTLSIITMLILALLALSCAEEPAIEPVAESAPAPAAQSEPEIARLGGPMPPYEAMTLDGRRLDLQKPEYLTLVNIWATWCGPCRYEIPALIEFQKRYGPRGLEVLGISIDAPGTLEEIQKFAAARNINYPISHDPNGRIAELFQARVIPTSALVDPKGKIIWMHVGLVRQNDPELNRILEQTLNPPADPAASAGRASGEERVAAHSGDA